MLQAKKRTVWYLQIPRCIWIKNLVNIDHKLSEDLVKIGLNGQVNGEFQDKDESKEVDDM